MTNKKEKFKKQKVIQNNCKEVELLQQRNFDLCMELERIDDAFESFDLAIECAKKLFKLFKNIDLLFLHLNKDKARENKKTIIKIIKEEIKLILEKEIVPSYKALKPKSSVEF